MRLISMLMAVGFALSTVAVSADGQGRGNGHAKAPATQTTRNTRQHAKNEDAYNDENVGQEQRQNGESGNARRQSRNESRAEERYRRDDVGKPVDRNHANHADGTAGEKCEARGSAEDASSRRHDRGRCPEWIQELGPVRGGRTRLEQSGNSVRRSESQDDRSHAWPDARDDDSGHADVARSGHPVVEGGADDASNRGSTADDHANHERSQEGRGCGQCGSAAHTQLTLRHSC